MPDTNKTSAAMVDLIAKKLGVPRGEIRVTDLTSQFKWIKKHHVIWGLGRKDKTVIVVLGENKMPMFLSDPGGIALLSGLLYEENGSIPGSLTAFDLALAIRRLTQAPPGLVGAPELLTKGSPPLHAWLDGKSNVTRELFEKYCKSPTLEVSSADKGWILRFFYFNPRGGVESWLVKGDEARILTAEHEMSEPDGTFNWPFEG
jgi:hypothetical protein